jgi:two-component system alkaline phosphatase synthesis response regulator PhoP
LPRNETNKRFAKNFIVFLSARAEEFSQLAGYDAGANDYIVKIIKPKVLISKVNALLQLSTQVSESQSKVLELGDLIIDKDNFKVSKAGENLLLPKKNLICFIFASIPKKFLKEKRF